MKIVITVNKNDVWFCRICVASVRFYYPDVPILLLKDELNGRFSTVEMERYWQVQLMTFPITKFGWSAAKMHLYTDPRFAGEKFLVLDADIIMVGKVLDQPFLLNNDNDVIVNADEEDVYAPWFKQVYYDINAIQKHDPTFEYPGYVFNCGQLFCKGNFLLRGQLAPYFNFAGAPSWKDTTTFPMVDQSVFNYLLPTLQKKGKLSIGKAHYMLWSELEAVKQIPIAHVIAGNLYPFVIHYAGALRTPLLNRMTRADLLFFFEKLYYSKIPLGKCLKHSRKLMPLGNTIIRRCYHALKKTIIRATKPAL